MDALKRPWIWVALLVALLVRIPAITTLPIDWDEPIYMESAQALVDAFRTGSWSLIFEPIVNPEHPGLVKLLYGIGFCLFGGEPDLVERLIVVRGVSLVAGLLLVFLAARFHPVAGLALAAHTLHAKYSCEGYLDAVPATCMAWSMLLAWKHRERSRWTTILLCGCLWGAAIAGKWIHGVPGLLLLFIWKDWRTSVRLGLVAMLSLWLLDPTMWVHPIERTVEMIQHHRNYALTVPQSSLWTPWVILAGGGPAVWHPEIFQWSIDGVWLALGLLGLGMQIRTPRGRFLAAWFLLPMMVLMTWETRWPQHLMVVLTPLCLGVAASLKPLLNHASRSFEPSDSHPPTSG